MKTNNRKYSKLSLNILVALIISLVVNFSYLLLVTVDQNETPSGETRRNEPVMMIDRVGELSITPNGHGYIVYSGARARIDTIYVPQSRINRFGLKDGDKLKVSAAKLRSKRAYPVIAEILERNGEQFDAGVVYNQTSAIKSIMIRILFYMFVAFISLSLLTSRNSLSQRGYIICSVLVLVISLVFYYLTPLIDHRTGRMTFCFLHDRIDYFSVLRSSFVAVVTILYGRLYQLISLQQHVELENEQLKNENLTTRYNMLAGQVNPHFFFNSLNSLAMLVRENEKQRALQYIDQLSYTFRYIIQSGRSTTTTLADEIKFVESYGYLFKIRYDNKLFIEIDIDERYMDCELPVLSLQPLIDNAVKHNVITSKLPLKISISVYNGKLVVSNPIRPKLEPEIGTGIGLENLNNRWELVNGCKIEVSQENEIFAVKLPLKVEATKQND